MNRPALKRSTAFSMAPRPPVFQESEPTRAKIMHPVPSRFNQMSQIIPAKLLEQPETKSKEKSHLVGSLMVENHKYPARVLSKVGKDTGDLTRGIGAFRSVNWYFYGKILSLWQTGKNEDLQLEMDSNITSVEISQLRACSLPSKLRNKLTMAISVGQDVFIYSLNSFTLESSFTNIKYSLKHSLQVEKVAFVDGNKLVIVCDTGILEMVEIGDEEVRRSMEIPFYRKFLPISIQESTKKILKIIYTNKKIYTLVTEIRKKNWLKNAYEHIFNNDPDSYTNQKYIQTYEIGARQIVKGNKLGQKDIMEKVRTYTHGPRNNVEIHSIFIDRHNDDEGELGIVTECGCFLTFRNNSHVVSREPLFIPDVSQLGSCQFLSKKGLDQVNQTGHERGKLLFSLGYDNLTLTQDSLLFLSDERIDGVLSVEHMGEIVEKTDYSTEGILEKTRQWALFNFQGYFTVKKLPLRHYIGTLFYLKTNLRNEYLGFNYNQSRFDKLIEKYIEVLTPSVFLTQLIYLLLSKETFLMINPFLINLLESQLREDSPKNFKDWTHVLNNTIKKQDLYLNEACMQNIWAFILDLQCRDIEVIGHRFVSIYETSTLWKTMHSIYYKLVSPLFHMKVVELKENKILAENIHQMLQLIENFFSHKQSYELNLNSSKPLQLNSREGLNILDVTSSSFQKEDNLQWLSEPVRRIVATRGLSSHHLVLEEKIKTAFKATSIFMSLHIHIEDLVVCPETDLILPIPQFASIPFKELLSSREHQNDMKKLLISQTNIQSLVDLSTQIPLLNIEKDLKYVRMRNRIVQDQMRGEDVDPKELSECITSDYFQDIEKLFRKRPDFVLNSLILYQEQIFTEKQELIPSNTLKERSHMNKTYFPQDQEQILKHKRTFLDRQLELTLEEQKQCISRAVQAHSRAREKSHECHSLIIGNIFIAISNKPYLISHMGHKLKESNLIKELQQISRMKPLESRERRADTTTGLKCFKRELFPRKGYY